MIPMRLSTVLRFLLLLCVFFAVASGAVSAQQEETVTVSDAGDLDAVRDDLDGDYVLTGDIDMSDVGNFEPIGSRDGESFTGSFEGGGHVIGNLTVVDRNGNGVGLFGAVGEDGVISNVGVEDVDVTGGDSVGGIVGFNRGNVTRSYVTGSVTGRDDYVGGIVGWNRGGFVSQSYSKARVRGSLMIGGVAGLNNGGGDVELTYAAGRVSATAQAGGLVGKLGDRNQLAGRESLLRDSYWDTGSTGQGEAVGNVRSGNGEATVENAEGLSTDEMQGNAAEENMDAFNFVNTWSTVDDDYPVLSWQTSVLSADDLPLPGFGFIAVLVAFFAVMLRRTTNLASDR